MFLLLDECCGKSLVQVAEDAGHTAQRTIEVAVLGRGAPDNDIFDFARRQGVVLVTVNRGDFISQPGKPWPSAFWGDFDPILARG